MIRLSGTFNADGKLTCGCIISGLSIRWCSTHAAARELLTALKDMLDRFTVYEADGYQDPGGTISRARALLAKIKGKEARDADEP